MKRSFLRALVISRPRFGEGDRAATYEIALIDAGRDWRYGRSPMPWRLFLELLEKQVVCPTAALASLVAKPQKRRIPMALFLVGYARIAAIAGPVFDKFAVSFDDRRHREDFEPACRAFPGTRRQDAVAIRTKLDGLDRNTAIFIVGSALFAVIKNAAADIRDTPKALMIAGLIEDDQM